MTPSFNQGCFLEETIRSVVLQGYPDVEYMVLDGGSHDSSLAVIRRYARWLTAWRSGPDGGQAAAVNEGLAIASGAIFHFINSDDVLAPRALARVGAAWAPGRVIAGAVAEFADDHEYVVRNANLSLERLLTAIWRSAACSYHQPGVWLERERLASLGGFEADLRYCFDFHAFARYLERWPAVEYLTAVLVRFRLHAAQKTGAESEAVGEELAEVRRRLAVTLASPHMRALARRGLRMASWPNEVSAIRASRRPPLQKIASLVGRAVTDPAVALNRLTLGAIRRELFPAGAGR